MTTLPEALAALDAHICNDNSCMFAPAKRGGMGTNGGCQCVRGRPFIAPALAAVVKAARESVRGPAAVDHRALLLSLCASLTLADHMGDAYGDIIDALTKAGVLLNEDDSDDDDGGIHKALAKLGVRTLHGTALSDGDEDEESGDGD